MAETYGAQYVSLHVRISNTAALHLYRDMLGFSVEKTEAKYYADGEDAFSMRMDLSDLKAAIRDERDEERDDKEATGTAAAASATANGKKESSSGKGTAGTEKADQDEGEAVGSLGKKGDGEERGKTKSEGDKKRRVKVGRGLGVGDLVEKNESAKV